MSFEVEEELLERSFLGLNAAVVEPKLEYLAPSEVVQVPPVMTVELL